MQTLKLSLVLSLASATMIGVHGQPASPEAQEKAIELLRQTISEGGTSGSSSGQTAPAMAEREHPMPSKAMPEHQHSTPSKDMSNPPPAVAPASPDQQQQALELLRQKMNEPAAAMQPAQASTEKPKKAKPSKSAGSKTSSNKPA